MTGGFRRAVRLVAAVLASVALALGPVLPAAAEDATPQTYKGPAFSPDVTDPPTRTASQSKLWFHAGTWWALLAEPAGRATRVFELMPDHSWRPTSAVVNTDAADIGDALLAGDTVHTVSRRSDTSLQYARLTYDAATRDYRADPPVLVPTRGASPPAVIAEDTRGRLWIAFASAARTAVTYSDNGGQTWARPFPLATRLAGETAEAVALVSYDDRIGLLWSDQTTGSFQFASHRDGDWPGLWSREQALAGPAQAGDHISLRRIQSPGADTLVAAVRTAPRLLVEPPGTPVLEVLIRAPDGRWSTAPVSTNTDGLEDPVLQVDEATRTLHLFASRNGSIVTKRSPLDAIGFPSGLGDLFMLGLQDELVDPTTSRDPVGFASGVVVLATDDTNRAYRHTELPIPSPTPVVDPADATPPGPPGELQATVTSPDSVILSWAAATDGDRWVPARNGVPVQSYVVLRDGVEVSTVTSTSAQDRPPPGAAERSVRYQVQAVDAAGNRSAPAEVVVTLPGTDAGAATPRGVAMGLLPLAAVAGLIAIGRGWLVRG